MDLKMSDSLNNIHKVISEKIEKIKKLEWQELIDLPQIIDKYAKYNSRSDAGRNTGYYHPSDLALEPFCPRHASLARLNLVKEETFNTNFFYTFEYGKFVHDFVEDLLSRCIYTFKSNVPVIIEELKIKGSADGVYELENGQKVVVEIKTTSSNVTKPFLHHELQLMTYQFALETNLGSLLYVYKPGSYSNLVNFKYFNVPFSFNKFKTILDRIMFIESCIANNTEIPAIECATCFTCPLRRTCNAKQQK
jgi:CRISPR/Cas system-associated exonuclease Cas4 (RecB family)